MSANLGKGVWIILEGPDGSGKSTAAATLASALADSGPTVLQHLTSRSLWGEYYEPARLWRLWGLNVVQDRCMLSDLAYAPVLSGVSSRHGEERVRNMLDNVARHAIVLLFFAEEEALAARLRERGDDLIDESMLHAIMKNYHREAGWWAERGAKIVEFDTTDSFPSRLDLELAVSIGVVELER